MALRLAAGVHRSAYGPVAGDPTVRAAVAGYFGRRRVPTEPDQVVLAPGSKALLLALQIVVPGHVVLPRPSWVTYAPQARLARKPVHVVPIATDHGGVPDPALLRRAVAGAQGQGLIVLTIPDNPTGTTASPELVRRICAIAEEKDLLIVSDEIYRDLRHHPDVPFLSPAEVAPERTVVLTGLSKSMALGGWRIGAARFPAAGRWRSLRDAVLSIASEMWSALAGPMQEVAEYAFSEPPELRTRVAEDARLHAAVASAVHRLLIEAGATNSRPTGGFYCYPDFESLRAPMADLGIRNSAQLQQHLLEEHGVAVLSGHHFGDDSQALRFRVATSMVYGDSEEEQMQALQSRDPAGLPHIRRQLDTLAAALANLSGRWRRP
nr:pyridoxal phosphate-dependent aminotransferase [Actinopolyspora biskrensis]